MDWAIDLLKQGSALAPIVIILLGLLMLEKKEHGKTKEELKKCYESRISENAAVLGVVSSSNAASAARDASQNDIVKSMATVSASLQLLIAQVGAHWR